MLQIAVAAGFFFGALAPWIARGYGRRLPAIVPFGLAIYFSSYILDISGLTSLEFRFPWIPSLGIAFDFRLDGLSLIFALIITWVGGFILLYAAEYYRDNPRAGLFQGYLLAFMASMLGLVLSANLLLIFVFWELTSIFSYLLIGFEHRRDKARKSALQALLVTGGGGLALLAGFILVGKMAGTYDVAALLESGDSLRTHELYVPAVALILLGAFTKSAQFPFHFWLPNAMEAPTPASAYLHSSTMVKAGVYLLALLAPVLGGTPLWENALMTAGGFTMLTAAWLALSQVHLKALLAYGTVWALGVLVLLLGLGTPHSVEVAMVLLVAHSLYKACLFMVAGIIDSATGEKNVEKLGGLRRTMPVTALVAFSGGLSMAGLPPSLGFIAKELLLEVKLRAHGTTPVLLVLALFTGMVMVYIAVQVSWRPFFGKPKPTPKPSAEPGRVFLLGPVVMALMGVVFGAVSWPLAQELLAPAIASILRQPVTVELSLWHGFNQALLYSAITFAGGLAMVRMRGRIRKIAHAPALRFMGRYGPEGAYRGALAGMLAFARYQTRLLQGGSLGVYLAVTVSTGTAAAGYGLLTRYGLQAVRPPADVRWYEACLFLFMMISALAVPLARTRMLSIAALGAVGFGTVLLFLLFGGPDLAMTQFIIEIITVILLLFAFYHLPDFSSLSSKASRLAHAGLAAASGACMFLMMSVVTLEPHSRITADFYAARSLAEAHGRNIVNVILVDFRALDTLGEISVLAAAALGVTALLRYPRRKDHTE